MELTKIKTINWYKQGGAIKLFYVLIPYISMNETIGYDRNIVWQKKEINTGFFDRDKEKEKALWVFKEQKKDKKFIEKWVSGWKKKVELCLNFCEKYFKKSVDKWIDKELVVFCRRFEKLDLDHWKKGCLIEWTDPDGQNLLYDEVKKSGVSIYHDEIKILTSPEKLSYLQEEQIDRFKIAQKLSQGKNVDALIRKHAQRYYWIKNTWYEILVLDENYFKKEILNDLKHLNKAREDIELIKKSIRKLKVHKKNILNEKRVSPQLKNLFYLFSRLSEFRDYRKKLAMCIPNHYLYKILVRLACENRLSLSVAGCIIPWELNSWKLGGSFIRELKKRYEFSIFLCNLKKEKFWVYDKKAREIHNALMESFNKNILSGTVANRGTVKGIVRVIETKQDFQKMKTGDILVAQMTRPEYMPILKKAGAIVTDEGGITCHAAIVSREMNIPCIIGTQTASVVLKDGDFVEVDADKGIIRKI